ncbi:type IV conjugative transfer system pilin TraA [Escherichia coli]|uniref:Pilin n=1 Tax=Escherichia coli TaxID=562 RepID=A0A377HHC5_ECOLX|nr:type IV conjugative transfer system pilin TraA [Escherichia coli]
MNLSLSEGGRPRVCKKPCMALLPDGMAWSVHPKSTVPSGCVLSAAVTGMGQMAHATDLLAGGKNDVKATFGADSFVIMCIYIAEIVIGVATYIRTKNLLILLGLVVVIVFTTVGLTFVN